MTISTPDEIKAFIEAGGILAWGIVPTGDPDHIENESVDTLADRWQTQAAQMVALGLDAAALTTQSLITPSCGAGSLSIDRAEKVLKITEQLSQRLRRESS